MHFPRAAAAAIAASASLTSAAGIRGFNTASNGKKQADFQAEFQNQKNIAGTNGEFTSCRLYTMIQDGTSSDPISAIPAAIAEGTTLLLGLWASAGQDAFNLELAALTAAIKQYGTSLSSIVTGISVGSEDLYRDSPTGIENGSNPGENPAVIASYISQVRKVIAGTALSSAPIGHVDTWNAWTNSSNSAVVDAVDFLGVDEYPYYQSVNTNAISDAQSLFYEAVQNVQTTAGSKPVWITEAGWPTSGPTVGEAVASVANARQFWLDVFCTLPASTPVYWYIQVASAADSANFGVVGNSLSTTPVYDLSCDGATPYNPSSGSSSSGSSSSANSGSGSSTAAPTTQTTKGSSGTQPTSTGSGHSTTVTGSGQIIGASTRSTTTTSSVSLSSQVSVQSMSSQIMSSPILATSLMSTTLMSTTLMSTTLMSTPSMSSQVMNSSVSSTIMGTGTGVPMSTSTPTPAMNSGSNTQIYTLALLAVPALLALFA